MDRLTTARLARARADRLQLLDAVKRCDLEIGRLAKTAMESSEYTTQSGVARVLGVSHTHVRNLIQAAEAADEQVDDEDASGIPMLPNEVAGEYVRSRGARIVRSVSAFHDADVLHATLLDPRLFGDGGLCNPPAMLWHLDNGEWVGVTDATVGYGGTGCGWSINALEAAGVDADTAKHIVSWRYCDAVQIDDRSTWHTQTIWPVHPRSNPNIVQDRIVIRFGDAVPVNRHRSVLRTLYSDPDPTGFYPSTPQVGDYEAWLDLLDSTQPPPWARGPRVARVFLSPSEAEIQGFVLASDTGTWGRRSSSPIVVVEQGSVQLWGYFYPPENKLLPQEVYQALALANVYPTDLAAADEMRDRPLRRFMRRFVGPDTKGPSFVDVSASGQEELTFVPAPQPPAAGD